MLYISLKKSFLMEKICGGRSRTAATSKMEIFVIVVQGCKPLITFVTASSISDFAAVLDLLLYADRLYKFLQILQIAKRNRQINAISEFSSVSIFENLFLFHLTITILKKQHF